MADVDAQVLGHSASSYNLISAADQNALIAGMNGHMAVTIGTIVSNRYDDSLSYGLFGSHAYAVIGYSGGLFTLYNPWGIDQPTQALSWAQLQTVCDGFVVASTANPAPFTTLSRAVRAAAAPRPASDAAPAAAPVAAEGSSAAGSQAAPQAAVVDAVLASVQAWSRQDSAAGQTGFDSFGLGSLNLIRSLQPRDAASAAAGDQSLDDLSLAVMGARL
jgi:hypothetical protein